MSAASRICVEPTVERAVELAAEIVKIAICEACDQRRQCCLALAGGSTPQRLYQRLSQTTAGGEVPWNAVQVFFGDERDVSLDDVESNYRMVQRALLDRVPVEPGHIHPMRGDAENLDDAAGEYEELIRRMVPPGPDGRPRFDLVLLGMGADGHTASLFPDSPALDEGQKLVAAQFVPVLGRKRLTFTLPLINAARQVILFVTGDDKADAMAALVGQDTEARASLPAARVQPADGVLIYICDSAAGRRIRE